VRAVVLNDGTSSYLSITAKQTGFPIGGVAADALAITETSTGVTGKPLGAAITQAATNALFTVDGLSFERDSNTAVDAVPGTTLNLKATTAVAETLTLGADLEATKASLQKYVDAYNEVLKLVQKQLAVTEGTNRASTLAGDMAVKNLQSRLQQVSTAQVLATGAVQSLADIGIKTARDGSLSLDEPTLSAAVARDPAAVDALFSRAGTGLAASIELLVDQQTDATDGILQSRKTSLGELVKRMDAEAEKLQLRIDSFRNRLIREFMAMENIVSALNSTSSFLAQQSALTSAAGGNRK
jgi:flagellar hook-associated protein 2